MKRAILIIGAIIALVTSCRNEKEEKAIDLLNEWNGKAILFPRDMHLISYIDTNAIIKLDEIRKEYTILHYVDTIGCVSCKLNLSGWDKLMKELDSIGYRNINCLISFFPLRKKELLKSLKINKFKHYIYIDDKDSLNLLNHFPEEDIFRTFLLDRNNKVIAVGNPVYNPKVKELYLKIIQGDKIGRGHENEVVKTKVSMEKTSVSLGSFDWQEEQKAIFTLKNTGNHPLVIEHVNTSCGCTTADYPKEPVRPGNSVSLQVTYKADHPEHFNKTITVYCNAEASPIQLKISGEAEQKRLRDLRDNKN